MFFFCKKKTFHLCKCHVCVYYRCFTTPTLGNSMCTRACVCTCLYDKQNFKNEEKKRETYKRTEYVFAKKRHRVKEEWRARLVRVQEKKKLKEKKGDVTKNFTNVRGEDLPLLPRFSHPILPGRHSLSVHPQTLSKTFYLLGRPRLPAATRLDSWDHGGCPQ